MANAYKLAKEAFVSNLHGGTILEINAITLVAPASVFLWSALQSQQSFFTPYTFMPCLVDFLLNCGAILLATTLYSSHPILFSCLLVLPALLVILSSNLYVSGKQKSTKPQTITKNNTASVPEADPFPVKPFVTNYRGSMMVITCIAILAVDFRVFPRRFAKVENWGTSLMDLGVGSFVFSAGTVSARSVLLLHHAKRSRTIFSRLRSAGRHAIPLFVLGLIRLYSVKGLDYAEHVTEYGVHWNFFFTLAFVPPFVALFDALFSFLPSYAVLSLIIGTMYEMLLDFTDLKGFILSAPRTNMISKNREGLFSFFGYLAIFLAGQATGMYILPRNRPSRGRTINATLRKLILWSGIWSALFSFSISFNYGMNLRVSRRLANLPYVLWVSAFNTCQLAVFCAIESLFFPELHNGRAGLAEKIACKNATSCLLRAMNRNGLAIFLMANLLTGLINMVIPTLNMSASYATGLLLVYSSLVSGTALILDWRDVSVKL